MFVLPGWVVVSGFLYSCFAVFSQWGFWENGSRALGLNSTISILFFWVLLLASRVHRSAVIRDLRWFLPLWLVGLSFFLYENPWLNSISVVVLPLATGVIYCYRAIENADGYYWGLNLSKYLLTNCLRPVGSLSGAMHVVRKTLANMSGNQGSSTFSRVTLGVVILVPLSTVILFLLGSADQKFAVFIESVFSLIKNIFDLAVFWQALTVLLLFLLVLASLLCWNNLCKYKSAGENEKSTDSVVAGIVVAGLLIIYILFIYIQIGHVFSGSLPIDFKSTVKIVKSGFWQLVIVSVINVVVFLWVYQKTKQYVQWILRFFIVLSGLIVISAGWRMGLYVFWYGLSYEKFFASYTVIFSAVIFSLLIRFSFLKTRKNLGQFIAFLSIWFYGISTILPVEKIIFHSNLHLSQISSSRIDLAELTALSVDVLSDARAQVGQKNIRSHQLRAWIRNKENIECPRGLLEWNISAAIACPAG